MNDIYLAEQCPRAKQDLQYIVDNISDKPCELCINCANLCMNMVCYITGELTTIDNYCGNWENGN